MAFGDQSKKYHDTNTDTGSGGGEKKSFESPWMPTGSGTRIFRPLQAIDGNQLVMTDRLSASGKPLREGNKKTGAILQGPIPADETVFLSAWWTVNSGGTKRPGRIMLDPLAGGDPNYAKFKNPLWEHIQKNYPKTEKVIPRERNAIKTLFGMNVWDMTPVMRNDQGFLFYPAEDGTWRLLASSNKLISPSDSNVKLPEHYNMHLEDALEGGFAEPLNKIRIFEGSYGKPGGKHLFAQFDQLVDTVEDGDGLVRRLGEFHLRLSTTGTDMDTSRAIRNVNNFSLLPKEANFGNRYDIATWVKPWPNEAVQRIIDGEDYKEIITEYNLAQFPQLFDHSDDTPIAAVVEEEGLFEDE